MNIMAEQKKIYLSKPRSWIWETEAYTIQQNLQAFVVFDPVQLYVS
jgi:hypothetical protein